VANKRENSQFIVEPKAKSICLGTGIRAIIGDASIIYVGAIVSFLTPSSSYAIVAPTIDKFVQFY